MISGLFMAFPLGWAITRLGLRLGWSWWMILIVATMSGSLLPNIAATVGLP